MDFENGEFHRRIDSNVSPQFRVDSVLGMFKDGISKTMARQIRASARPRQQCRRPEVSSFFISDIERLSAGIAHWIVLPGREPKLMGVLTPRIRCSAFGNDCAKG